MGGAIECPLCGNNQAYCKCTRLEKAQFLEIAKLRMERMTADERAALGLGGIALLAFAYDFEERNMEKRCRHFDNAAASLRGLLARNPLPEVKEVE